MIPNLWSYAAYEWTICKMITELLFRKMNASQIMKQDAKTISRSNIENILQYFIWLLEW